jgi:tRNA A37 threonylcarbamoyladenosine modification protein TsaB
VAAFASQLNNENQLLKCRKESIYWNFYEWQTGLDGHIGGSMDEENRTYDAPMNAFFSMALRSIAKLEASLGNHTAAKDYLAQKAALDARMNELFWDAEHGVYASFVKAGERYHYAELTNALIVYADACPAEHEDSVLAALAAKTMLPVTLSHSIFKYESLLRRPAQYAKAVFDEIADVFGKMLYNNATTFYETVDGARAFGNAGSLCHAWSAIPTYLYHAYVLGLKPTENGFASYEIKPVDAGIHDAEGLVITPIGKITL